MTRTLLGLALALLALQDAGETAPARDDRPARPADDISIRVVTAEAGDLILEEEVWVEAPVEAVWDAYTTSAGYMAWAAPLAEVDLRVGGLIRTNYAAGGALGDENTNTLHITAYVPLQLLTLRAELNKNWPDLMKQDADRLSNTILFDRMGPRLTRIRSYGIGYRDTPEYSALMKFFIQANRGLYKVLKAHLE